MWHNVQLYSVVQLLNSKHSIAQHIASGVAQHSTFSTLIHSLLQGISIKLSECVLHAVVLGTAQ